MPDTLSLKGAVPDKAKADQSQAQPRSYAGQKVTVGCKLPHGLVLHIDQMVEVQQLTSGNGYRTVQESQQVGETITLNGNAVPFGVLPEYQIIAGYALTHNVDKDFWEAWLEQNKNSMIVRNKLVYGYDQADAAVSHAREMKETRSGLEPLNVEFRTETVDGRQRTRPIDPRYPSGIKTGRRDAA